MQCHEINIIWVLDNATEFAHWFIKYFASKALSDRSGHRTFGFRPSKMDEKLLGWRQLSKGHQKRVSECAKAAAHFELL